MTGVLATLARTFAMNRPGAFDAVPAALRRDLVPDGSAIRLEGGRIDPRPPISFRIHPISELD